jgi:DNA mismatch repair protein MutS
VIDDLPLFAAAPVARPVKQDGQSPLQERLATVHPDEMTAREALMLLYELKDLAEKP